MKKLLALLLMSCTVLMADFTDIKEGTVIDEEHVMGPAGTPIHKRYYEYLKEHRSAFCNPKHKEVKRDLDAMYLPVLPTPTFKGGMWMKERWMDQEQNLHDGYYIDRVTGFLYDINKKPIDQAFAKKARLSGYSVRPMRWLTNEQACFMENLITYLSGPVLILIMQESH